MSEHRSTSVKVREFRGIVRVAYLCRSLALLNLAHVKHFAA